MKNSEYNLSLNLLTKELYEYKKALKKSKQSFLSMPMKISIQTRYTHIVNLHPKIEHLEKSIQILKTNL
jgi:hypothetical protein